MTRLLVSVRNEEEARAAVRGGAHVIDVKEPDRGSLGRADRQVIAAIAATVGTAAPVSAALGELLELPPGDGALPAGVRFAKLGLAGCRDVDDWSQRWAVWRERLAEQVEPVAVVYADAEAARAPAPDDILRLAASFGCRTMLVDTFDKRRGNLLDHWSFERLQHWLRTVEAAGLQGVVAGSLSLATLPRIVPLRPALVAVRGAACTGGLRVDRIDEARVRRLAELLSTPVAAGVRPGR